MIAKKNSCNSLEHYHNEKKELRRTNACCWCLQQTTNPVLIVDDLDYAAVLVLHWGRGHWLFWLHWLCCFLLQLLLRDNTNTQYFDQQHTIKDTENTHRENMGSLLSSEHDPIKHFVCFFKKSVSFQYTTNGGKQRFLFSVDLILASDV